MPRGALAAKQDPLAKLDAAMEETLAGIEESGSGVEASDVIAGVPPSPDRAPARPGTPARTAPRRAAPTTTPGRDERGRFVQATPEEGDDADFAETLVDEQPRQPTRAAAEDDDDILARYDAEDEEGGADDAASAYADAEEVGEGDLAEPEGSRARVREPEPAEEGEQPQRRRPKLDKRTQALVDQAVKAQVATVLKERDELRAREAQQQQALATNQAFFRSVLGTEEELAQLQNQALNPNLSLAERNQASAIYQRYVGNRQFAAMYQQGLMTIIQQQQAADDIKAMKSFAQLQALDPKIVNEGNRAKTLVHAYRVGMQAAERELRKKYAERFRRMEREIETYRGSADEARVRGGIRRPGGTMASANGRRANGRIGRPDPLRGAMTYQRGIDPTSRVPFPTDELLKRIKDGELTLADIGVRSA